MHEKLDVPDATVKWLEGSGSGDGVTVFVAETTKAVEMYNSWRAEGKKVGGVFHSTC